MKKYIEVCQIKQKEQAKKKYSRRRKKNKQNCESVKNCHQRKVKHTNTQIGRNDFLSNTITRSSIKNKHRLHEGRKKGQERNGTRGI